MPTEHPAPLAPLLAALLLAACALAGTMARAASIESMVMPGPVIQAHADTEETCSACHSLFERTSQRGLCLDCHEHVSQDIESGTGFHGHDPTAKSADCKACHTEHKGRDADIVGLQPSLFDHHMTDFPLTGAHAAQSCGSCHETGVRYAEAPSTCAGCHQTNDVHGGSLGSDCAACHDTNSWQGGKFDHDSTDFHLTGAHTQTSCLGCHADQQFEAPAGSACIDCHRVDDIHEGRNGTTCGDCHDTRSWEASFDHFKETGFALIDAHAGLSCRNCHVTEGTYEGLATECSGCHAGDDVHLGRNGSACDDCHGQTSWKIAFDHEAETGYALLGAHTSLGCNDCHTEGLEKPLPVECIGCHDGDDPHGGTLPECENCHGSMHWDADLRFSHDLTSFALVGLHRVASCEQCHDSQVFSPVAHACVDCHADEDVHGGAMGDACETCHNPSGWTYWAFDHREVTGFALDGAHDGLACAACHPAGRPAGRQSRACVACHRADDVHNGRFGQNCDRCHLSTSFEELKDEL